MELQRFQTSLKLQPIKLRATFLGQTRNTTTDTAVWPPRARLVTTGATKFALLASIKAQARKNSPSTGKTAQNQPIFASRANLFAAPPRIQSRWASFFAPLGSTAASKHPPRPPRLKPMTPMRVDHRPEMKPPTPLRAPWRTRLKPLTPLLAQNSQIQAIFRPQRHRWFH